MIIEYAIPTVHDFLRTVPLQWCKSMGLLLIVALVIGFVLSLVRHGFLGSARSFAGGFTRGCADLFGISLRRTWAIARLTIKESIRRRVVAVCLVFLLILMFAGWFLDPNSKEPAKLFHSFVLSTTSYLVMLLAVFLSAFSLPTDFKTKTIYTVVTKPVRPSEMVLGRILGIGIIASLILVFMAGMSYAFVTLKLKHTHLLSHREDMAVLELKPGEGADGPRRLVSKGEMQQFNGHKHKVEIFEDGSYNVESVNGHTHGLVIEGSGEATRYTVLPEQGILQARTPIYGKLSFRNQETLDTREGINVGNEWMYRSYIGGGSRGVTNEEAAIFTFSNLKPEMFRGEEFREGLPIEMTMGVFRTYKADMEKRVSASISLRNPRTGLRVLASTFSTEEYITKTEIIPWKLDGTPQITQRKTREKDANGVEHTVVTPSDEVAERLRNDPALMDRIKYLGNPNESTGDPEREPGAEVLNEGYDFFEDFVDDGKVEVWLQCVDAMQYLGVAQADLYIRGGESPVSLNFVKGFFGIWQQMLIVIAFGVLFSTFLSSPITMISVVGVIIAGISKTFLMGIASNTLLGGGPFESLYRLVIQQNMVVDLPAGLATTFVKQADYVYSMFMTLIGQVIPPLSDFDIYYVALVSGFTIPGDWMVVHSLEMLAYVIPLFIVGYLILGMREVAK